MEGLLARRDVCTDSALLGAERLQRVTSSAIADPIFVLLMEEGGWNAVFSFSYGLKAESKARTFTLILLRLLFSPSPVMKGKIKTC